MTGTSMKPFACAGIAFGGISHKLDVEWDGAIDGGTAQFKKLASHVVPGDSVLGAGACGML